MITIVDYGLGNLGSIQNMFRRIGAETTITCDLEVIRSAKKLLLPGVGAFDAAMKRLNSGGLREVLDQKVLREHTPVLGICLGMQLLTEASEEGQLPGLGWVPAQTMRLPKSPEIKIPHMGWNKVHSYKDVQMSNGLSEEARFYFVHSYCVHVHDPSLTLFRAKHGIEFDAAIQYKNIVGAQFHPEKSHRFGMQFFTNFVNWQC